MVNKFFWCNDYWKCWLTDVQTESHAYGYGKFGKDFNNDGLVSGGSVYQLFGSSGIYTLKNSSGVTYSDDSTRVMSLLQKRQLVDLRSYLKVVMGHIKRELTLYGQQILLV